MRQPKHVAVLSNKNKLCVDVVFIQLQLFILHAHGYVAT
jgi:hypothetical protein